MAYGKRLLTTVLGSWYPRLLITVIFALPFIIPLWTVSRSTTYYGNIEKIRCLNEEGVRSCNEKNFTSSIDYFNAALRLSPDNKVIKKNLAVAYLEMAIDLKSRGSQDRAMEVLEKAVDLNANVEPAHSLLAKLYYERGDLIGAEKEARIALLLKPQDPYLLRFVAHINYLLEDYNEALDSYKALNKTCAIPLNTADVEKVREEQHIFSTYKKLQCHPFVIYYPENGVKNRAEWVAEALAQAYLRLGSWWGFNPQCEISVYLYPEEKFFKLTQSQIYVVGVYDGKIRLLANSDNKLRLQKTAVHEYTHHALETLTRSNIPFWVNEGLAQYVAGEWDSYRAKLFDMAIDRKAVLDFAKIEDESSGLFDVHDKTLAYVQAYVAVIFLVDQYGDKIICDLINGLKKGKKTGKILQDITLLSYDEFKDEVQTFYRDRETNSLSNYVSLESGKE